MSQPRLVVFANHALGARCLEFLIGSGETIAGVVTHQDDPEEARWFESVADLARAHSLPVFTPASPNTFEFAGVLRGLAPSLFFSVMYRRLLSPELLAIPALGAVNLHPSLLPKYRGRAPINWVLVNGETLTGVTLHHMIEEADAGDIIAQESVGIDPDDTAWTLYQKMEKSGVALLQRAYPRIVAGSAPRIPQDHSRATRYGKRRPEDGLIRWDRPAVEIRNLIRAVTHPFPGAFVHLNGKRLFLWNAREEDSEAGSTLPGIVEAIRRGEGIVVATGAGRLLLQSVQLEGEPELPADRFAERRGLRAGDRLGDAA